MKALCFLCALLFLTGCQTKVWTQPGKTEEQIRQDWAESQLVAERALVGIRPPANFSDNNFAIGQSFAGQRDARADAKKLAPLTMQSRGYQLVPISTVPTGSAYFRP